MIEIIYVISLIVILIIFMLTKKSDNKLNGLGILGLGVVLLLCYNVFECYVLNFFKIKLNPVNLSIVNFGLIVLWSAFLFKKKEFQKYIINLKDFIVVLIIAFVVFFIGVIQYGREMNIKYETTDAAVHYRATMVFAENDRLLNNVKDDIYNFRGFKIGAYVNSGILIKIASNYIDEIDYYKIYILFGLFVLFLIGYMLYFTFIKISKGKLNYLALVLAILCLIGYPLNSLLFGFEYLTISLLIICAIINMVSYYKEIKWGQSVAIFFLLNFELFCTYYFFVPFMYSALFIYFCVDNFKKDRKIFTKKNIAILLITLIIPFILGYAYHLKPDLYSENTIIYDEGVVTSPVASVSGLVSDGYIYKNLYSNIILLIPLAVYVLYVERKKCNLSTLMLIFMLGYMGLLFVGLIFGKVSEYYIAKNFFALWILLFYLNFKGLCYLYEKNIKIPYIVFGIYAVILCITLVAFNDKKIANTFAETKSIDFAEVYSVNKTLLTGKRSSVHTYEIQLLEYAKDNLDKSKKIEIMGSEQQILWAYDILDYISYYKEMDKFGHQEKLKCKYMNNMFVENADYIVCFYRSDFYKKYEPSLKDKEVLYENAFGKVINNGGALEI